MFRTNLRHHSSTSCEANHQTPRLKTASTIPTAHRLMFNLLTVSGCSSHVLEMMGMSAVRQTRVRYEARRYARSG